MAKTTVSVLMRPGTYTMADNCCRDEQGLSVESIAVSVYALNGTSTVATERPHQF